MWSCWNDEHDQSTRGGMRLDLILLLVGLVLLIKGADLLVTGAASFALKTGVSKTVVGLSLVALGTSVPELVSSMVASVKGFGDVPLSNVVGSNIANIGLCLAVAAIIRPIPIERKTVRAEVPFMILSCCVLLFMLLRNHSYVLYWNDGAVLLCFSAIYAYYVFTSAREIVDDKISLEAHNEQRLSLLLVKMIIGVISVIIGGKFTIDGAVGIAYQLGISRSLIALTIIAVGTSLPEIVVTITSVAKKEIGILVGNVVGSNIMNIFVVLGFSSLAGRLNVNVDNYWVDLFVLLVLSLCVFVFSVTERKITRLEGVLLTSAYGFYVAYAVLRG